MSHGTARSSSNMPIPKAKGPYLFSNKSNFLKIILEISSPIVHETHHCKDRIGKLWCLRFKLNLKSIKAKNKVSCRVFIMLQHLLLDSYFQPS